MMNNLIEEYNKNKKLDLTIHKENLPKLVQILLESNFQFTIYNNPPCSMLELMNTSEERRIAKQNNYKKTMEEMSAIMIAEMADDSGDGLTEKEHGIVQYGYNYEATHVFPDIKHFSVNATNTVFFNGANYWYFVMHYKEEEVTDWLSKLDGLVDIKKSF